VEIGGNGPGILGVKEDSNALKYVFFGYYMNK
jgi:hypothetical protein